jgi:hypothetical protein
MPLPVVWIFLFVGTLFAAVHNFAVVTSLYWYYPWFDIVMHFWGGTLVVLGVHAICSLKHVTLKPTGLLVAIVLVGCMSSWELFEYSIGLYNPASYWFGLAKDLMMGTIGGLVGYFASLRLRM